MGVQLEEFAHRREGGGAVLVGLGEVQGGSDPVECLLERVEELRPAEDRDVPSPVSLIRNADASAARPSAAMSFPSSILASRCRPYSHACRSHSAASSFLRSSRSSTPSPYAHPASNSATARYSASAASRSPRTFRYRASV
ncbi:hypothetical protein NEH16_18685 [Streptomyces drozdowiczii]|uniref:Uncharacterized protein n=1 Tax=Streptomyces drozdowiczii TaxID=202862 RepID=A0ABY6PU86_9ACTN|nr:hypothetical protein [Streptomyces drozdowiczii]UZK55869.1 hypothetical protein NEH16_18685 [Streptomyces drozdowiczii]